MEKIIKNKDINLLINEVNSFFENELNCYNKYAALEDRIYYKNECNTDFEFDCFLFELKRENGELIWEIEIDENSTVFGFKTNEKGGK